MESFAFNHHYYDYDKLRRALPSSSPSTCLVIMAVLAALVVPALKNFGRRTLLLRPPRSRCSTTSSRARRPAISERTHAYTASVPTIFWQGLSVLRKASRPTTDPRHRDQLHTMSPSTARSGISRASIYGMTSRRGRNCRRHVHCRSKASINGRTDPDRH